MEETFRQVAQAVAGAAEGAAILIVAVGVIQAVFHLCRYALNQQGGTGRRKQIWLGLALWLVLALEFELAADIVRSVLSPSWQDIGQLAAVGAVRTLLNFFLEKDLEKYSET